MIAGVALTAAAMGVGTAVFAHHGHDSIYPTWNALWTCTSGGSQTNGTNNTGNFCLNQDANVSWWADWAIRDPGYANVVEIASAYDLVTDLTTFEDWPGPTFSGSNSTNIVYEIRGDIPFGAIGITWCDEAIDSWPFTDTRCLQTFVAFSSNDVIDDTLACHETGHAIGLTHGSYAYPAMSDTDTTLGCMSVAGGTFQGIGNHNINQINSNY